MDKKMIEAMDAVFEELMAMPNDKFFKELELKGNGDIAAMLRYTGALAESFNYTNITFGSPSQFAPACLLGAGASNDYNYLMGSNQFVTSTAKETAVEYKEDNVDYACAA